MSNDVVHGILDYMKLQDRPSALQLQIQRRDYIEGRDENCLTISAPVVDGELVWRVVPSQSATTAITYNGKSMETVVTLIDGVQYPSDTEGIALLVQPHPQPSNLDNEAPVVMAGWFVRKDVSVVSRRETIRNALTVLLTK